MNNASVAIDEYRDKVFRLAPGERLCYHVGFLSRDRGSRYFLDGIATAVYYAYSKGRVVLIQRKLGDMIYEYYAVGRRP